MPSDYTQPGSHRPSRRGRYRPHPSNRSQGGSYRNRQEIPPPKKKSFWESLLGFFGRKLKKIASNHPKEEDAPARLEKPERPLRSSNGLRKPEAVEVTSPRIYVGNLSFDATESDLFELFNGVGTVQNVEIVINRYTMKSKGFAFIQMQTIDEAKRAVSDLHDKEYMGRKLVVSGAKGVEERRSERIRQPEQ